MARFVLRSRGGATSDELARRVRTAAGVTLVEATPRMLLVDGSEAAVRALIAGDDQWLVVPEHEVPLPDTRKKVRRPPRGSGKAGGGDGGGRE